MSDMLANHEADVYRVVSWQPGILPELAAHHELDWLRTAKRDLPSWFKFIANATTGAVITPAFLFLARCCIASNNSAGKRETLNAYAYDLRSWFEFLALEGQQWDEIDQNVFDEFLLDLAGGLDDADPGLARSTIKRRASAIASMYADARTRGLTTVEPRVNIARTLGRRPELAVRPIVPSDLRRILAELGPMPRKRLDGESSRLVLASLLSILSGARLSEICALTVAQIEKIVRVEGQPMRKRGVKAADYAACAVG